MKHRVGILWLQNELRTDDNPLLVKAAQECQQLIVLYCVNPKWFQANRYGLQSIGAQRWRFLHASLNNLNAQLAQLGQQLVIAHKSPLHAIAELITTHHVDAIYYAEHAGFYERTYAELLQRRYPLVQHHTESCQTLWTQAQLPFRLSELPDSFSSFRRMLETHNLRDKIASPLTTPAQLPPSPKTLKTHTRQPLPAITAAQHQHFHGGSDAARDHVISYFASGAASSYKATRNALDHWPDSTKFSPWLADGSLSVRRLHDELTHYEKMHGANESTYWIFFELLWREYFHWYARRHGRSCLLFPVSNNNVHKPVSTPHAGNSGAVAPPLTPSSMPV